MEPPTLRRWGGASLSVLIPTFRRPSARKSLEKGEWRLPEFTFNEGYTTRPDPELVRPVVPEHLLRKQAKGIPLEAYIYVSDPRPLPIIKIDPDHYLQKLVKRIEAIASSMAQNARMAPQPVSGRWERKDTRPAKKSATLQEVK